MTLSNAPRRRLPWRTIIRVWWRVKLARLFLWLARERPRSILVPILRRLVESAERLAGVTD